MSKQMIKLSKKNVKPISIQGEFRQDHITEEWIYTFTGSKQHLLKKRYLPKKKELSNKEKDCVLCGPVDKNDSYSLKEENKLWKLRVTSSSQPAFFETSNTLTSEKGPFKVFPSKGLQELLFFRSHNRDLDQISEVDIEQALLAYQKRYLQIMRRRDIRYISLTRYINTTGELLLEHPHFLINALPVVPGLTQQILTNAHNYYNKEKRCPHCIMLDFELEANARIINKNNQFVTFCPYASKQPFEVIIMPKDHRTFFERSSTVLIKQLALSLKDTIKKIKVALKDPAYKLILRTAPCDGKDYKFFHWFIEIIPDSPILTDFEASYDLNVCPVNPEEAADYLRNI